MNSKTIVLLIILSVITGTGIFLLDQLINRKDSPLVKSAVSFANITTKPKVSPTPTPKPTLPPLTENSNLEEELNSLNPSDYSNEFQTLKDSL